MNRTKSVFALFALIIIGFLIYLFLFEPTYRGAINTGDRVLLFAHRGYGNLAPDNSLEGARLALQDNFDGVDVDAQLSKDKGVVIFHDVSLERFTEGVGRVDAKTTEELQKYDLGTKYGNGFSGVYIKTFEDFVIAVSENRLLMVELKVGTASNTGIESAVNAILSKHNAYERVYISSFNPVVLYRLKHLEPKIKTVFIFMDSGWDPKRVAETKEEDRVPLPWYLRSEITRTAIRKIIKPDALSINYLVSERTIDKLQSAGYPVFLWSLNDTETIQWGFSKRPYGIITDEPKILKEIEAKL